MEQGTEIMLALYRHSKVNALESLKRQKQTKEEINHRMTK